MMNYVSRITILLLFLCLSCSTSGEEFALFQWDQTKCADPWGTGENDPNDKTRDAIFAFFEDEDILVESVEFRKKSGHDISCDACHCETGQQILILVAEESRVKMDRLFESLKNRNF